MPNKIIGREKRETLFDYFRRNQDDRYWSNGDLRDSSDDHIAIPIKFDCFIRAKRQRYLSEFLFFLLNLFFY